MPKKAKPGRATAAICALGATSVLLLATSAPVDADGPRARAVTDPLVAKECSACHMLYPAGLLPARSWQAIMAGLQNHFGENADLDPATRAKIEAYLIASASGSRRERAGGTTGAEGIALRITEQPWFMREHGRRGRISAQSLARRGAKSPSDCKACHRGAERGEFDDD